MFRYFSDTASKNKVTGILAAEFIILTSLMSIFVSVYFLFEVLAVLLFSIYYRYKCYKELGGVTGDTAGFFVTMAELLAALTIIW
jgi:adenosylcobinamide-GDP ribazoletransferase